MGDLLTDITVEILLRSSATCNRQRQVLLRRRAEFVQMVNELGMLQKTKLYDFNSRRLEFVGGLLGSWLHKMGDRATDAS